MAVVPFSCTSYLHLRPPRRVDPTHLLQCEAFTAGIDEDDDVARQTAFNVSGQVQGQAASAEVMRPGPGTPRHQVVGAVMVNTVPAEVEQERLVLLGVLEEALDGRVDAVVIGLVHIVDIDAVPGRP